MKTLSWVGTNSLTNSLHVLIITTLGSFRSPVWKPKRNLSRKTCGWGFFRPSKAGISEKKSRSPSPNLNPSLLVIGESTSWWLNQPIWNILVKLDHFPRVRDENPKIFEFPPPRSNIPWWIPGAVDDQQQQDHRLSKRRGAWKHPYFFHVGKFHFWWDFSCPDAFSVLLRKNMFLANGNPGVFSWTHLNQSHIIHIYLHLIVFNGKKW